MKDQVKVRFRIDSLKHKYIRPEARDEYYYTQLELGELYNNLRRADSSIIHYKIAERFLTASKAKAVLKHLIQCSYAYSMCGQYVKADEIMNYLPQNILPLEDVEAMVLYYTTLTGIKHSMADYSKAVVLADKAIEWSEKWGDSAAIARSNLYMGFILGANASTPEVFEYFDKARIYTYNTGSYRLRRSAFLALASYARNTKQPQKAEKYMQEAKAVPHNEGDSNFVFDVWTEKVIKSIGKDDNAAYATAQDMVRLAKFRHWADRTGAAYEAMYATLNLESQQKLKLSCMDSALKYYGISGLKKAYLNSYADRIYYALNILPDMKYLQQHYQDYTQSSIDLHENLAEGNGIWQRILKERALAEHDIDRQTIHTLKQGLGAAAFFGCTLAIGLVISMRRQRKTDKVLSESKELLVREQSVRQAAEAKITEQGLKIRIIKGDVEKERISKELDTAKTNAERNAQLLKEIETSILTSPLPSDYSKRLLGEHDESEAPLNEWDYLLIRFDGIRPDFKDKLLKIGPDLMPLDIRICVFIVMNINPKTMSQMLNITDPSLRNRRSEIRRKLGLDRSENLGAFLAEI
ncbi:MAG: hypothetical protein V4543_08790 [Bacteroidota bacterium]